ncbi:glycoside hydrolase family 11 protein [Streptomyces glaucus]|uniref:endo-1,4-beta-xylanase n=1 Tax=Streptomyces glaucus TaxID=284029 RepID=A0ABP5WGP7_9ACTN
MDGCGSYRPAFSGHGGVVAGDGGTRGIHRTARAPLPSGGVGDQLVQQFRSTSRGGRSDGGTRTTGNRFDAWSRAGTTPGSFTGFMTVPAEGCRSSGRADVRAG